MFDHVGIAVSDLAASEHFYRYRGALSVLGIEPGRADAHIVEWDDLAIGPVDREHPATRGLSVGLAAPSREAVRAFSHDDDGGFGVTLVDDGRPLTEHAHVAFPAEDRAIREFHGAAVAAGYEDHGAPGERPIYHPGYYSTRPSSWTPTVTRSSSSTTMAEPTPVPARAIPRFHLAMPVDDLEAARRFYGEVLGLPQGRSAATWIDWNLDGHQFVTHLSREPAAQIHNPVDGHAVPVPHFGLILEVERFHELAERLRAGGARFVIEPHVRFPGEPGEQWTMFLLDPAGNALEFKAFADDSQVFAT